MQVAEIAAAGILDGCHVGGFVGVESAVKHDTQATFFSHGKHPMAGVGKVGHTAAVHYGEGTAHNVFHAVAAHQHLVADINGVEPHKGLQKSRCVAPVAYPLVAVEGTHGVDHAGDGVGGRGIGIGVDASVFYLEESVIVLVEQFFAHGKFLAGLGGVGGGNGVPCHFGGPCHGVPTVGKEAFAAVVPRSVHQSAGTGLMAVAGKIGDILNVVAHRGGSAGMADAGGHPEVIALFAVQLGKGFYHVGIAFRRPIAPHDVLHVAG